MSRSLFALAAVAVSLVGLAALAEPVPSPLDPLAPVPVSPIETGVEGYRSFTEQPVADWKEANRKLLEPAVEAPGVSSAADHAQHGEQGK